MLGDRIRPRSGGDTASGPNTADRYYGLARSPRPWSPPEAQVCEPLLATEERRVPDLEFEDLGGTDVLPLSSWHEARQMPHVGGGDHDVVSAPPEHQGLGGQNHVSVEGQIGGQWVYAAGERLPRIGRPGAWPPSLWASSPDLLRSGREPQCYASCRHVSAPAGARSRRPRGSARRPRLREGPAATARPSRSWLRHSGVSRTPTGPCREARS